MGFGSHESSNMANYRFALLLILGCVVAVHGSYVRGSGSGDVEQTTKGKKDLLSVILPTNADSTGAKAPEAGNRTSEKLDDITSSFFDDDKRGQHPESTPNSSSNGNSHFHSHEAGDSNAGSTSNRSKAPVSVNGKVNIAPEDSNGSHSSYVSGKERGNSSDGAQSVQFPSDGGSSIPEVFEGAVDINGDTKDESSKSDGSVVSQAGEKGGKYSKENKDTPVKIDVEPYFIIDAPIRESDDGHGCKDGQRWSFGHCRDILD